VQLQEYHNKNMCRFQPKVPEKIPGKVPKKVPDFWKNGLTIILKILYNRTTGDIQPDLRNFKSA